MGLLAVLTGLLSISQQPNLISQSPTHQAFTLEVWLENSPFNGQAVSMYSNTTDHGFFGIEIHNPLQPLPEREKAVFIKNTSDSDSLFAMYRKVPVNDGRDVRQVFVQPGGEIEHATSAPSQKDVFLGNFSTADFTYWPDKKTYYALDFVAPGSGFVSGTFLACPREEYGQKFYQLLAITPKVEKKECIELDWLVYRDVKVPGVIGEAMSQTVDEIVTTKKEGLK